MAWTPPHATWSGSGARQTGAFPAVGVCCVYQGGVGYLSNRHLTVLCGVSKPDEKIHDVVSPSDRQRWLRCCSLGIPQAARCCLPRCSLSAPYAWHCRGGIGVLRHAGIGCHVREACLLQYEKFWRLMVKYELLPQSLHMLNLVSPLSSKGQG